MILKEKTPERIPPARSRRQTAASSLARAASCLAAGALLCGAFGGGITLCVPLIAVLDPFYGMCVFAGAAAAYIFTGTTGLFLTEIAAMPLMLAVRAFSGGRFSPAASGAASGIVFTLCGGAAAFVSEINGTLIAAVFFRGIICGAVTYFVACCACDIKSGGRIYAAGEKAAGTAVMYVLLTASLCSFRMGGFSPARAAGIFIVLAAGGRCGAGGAAGAAALSALGVILGEMKGTDMSGMIRSAPVIACAGMASGYFQRRGKTAAAAAFSLLTLLFTLFMGRISWASALMTDTVIAAAFYCFIPERLYLRFVNAAPEGGKSSAEFCAAGAALAASALRDTAGRAAGAAGILAEMNGGSGYDPSGEICGRLCAQCRDDIYCCKGGEYRTKYVLPDAVRVFKAKGHVDEKELPKALESCAKKAELAALVNEVCSRASMERRLADISSQLRDNMSEVLAASAEMLSSLGEDMGGRRYDAALAAKTERIISAAGGEDASAAAFYDSAGHVFISCFYKGNLAVPAEEVTEKLSLLADADLEPAEAFAENGLTRLRWHEIPEYAYERGIAERCGSDGVSGDRSAEFSDGFGNVYFIISDGMGSGPRAALESRMTVSVLTRLIKAGVNEKAAVRMVNLILLSASDDEVLSTLDLMKINLMTGRASMIKAGAPAAYFNIGGAVRTVSGRSLPLGIISPVMADEHSLRLSDGCCAVMLSDGVEEEHIPRVRELILSEGYSPEKLAAEIADSGRGTEKYPIDDRTVIVVKLHKL